MATHSALDHIKFYNTYLPIPFPETPEKKNIYTDCPFCAARGKPSNNKFVLATESGLTRCLVCPNKEGNCNHFSFITKFHEMIYNRTRYEDYERLGGLRGLNPDTLNHAGLAYNRVKNEWLIPYYNPKATTLNNLGRCKETGPSAFKVMKAPAVGELFRMQPYNPGWDLAEWDTDEVIFCEGEWDTLAAVDMLSELPDCPMILGTPGAETIPVKLGKYLLKKKTAYVWYDYDESGISGAHRMSSELFKHFDNINVFNWEVLSGSYPGVEAIEEAVPDKMDLKDFYHAAWSSDRLPKKFDEFSSCWNLRSVDVTDPHIEERDTPGYVSTLADIDEVGSLKDYFRMYSQHMMLSQTNRLAIIAGLAISTSVYMRGEPLWGFMIGPASCLSGETQVKINRAGKTFSISLEKLYRRWNGKKLSGPDWDKNIPTFIQQKSEDGSIRLVPLNNVILNGLKEVHLVTTETGKTIKATLDHKFLTPSGWKELKDLSSGDEVLSNQGRIRGTYSKHIRQQWVSGVINHPHHSWNSSKKRPTDAKVLKHRLVVEANMNNLSLECFIEILRKDSKTAATLKYLSTDKVVHHKDNNRKNNELSNLEVMTDDEHKRLHCHAGATSNVLEHVAPDKIVSIELIGTEAVYDLSVPHPHNFLANDIVVHNCGKTVFIESFGGKNEMFDYASKITDKALVNGWGSGEDGSFFNTIDGKTFLVKDFTTVINMDPASQKALFDILRDIYDGSFKQTFGNSVERNYRDTNFNMLAGVTDAIYSHNDSDMGERFLRISYMGEDTDENAVLDKVFDGFGQTSNKKKDLTAATLGYVKRISANRWDVERYPRLSGDVKHELSNLAKYIARVRTKPKTHRTKGIVYRPRPEVAARLLIQLQKFSYATTKVVDPTVDPSDNFDLHPIAAKVVRKVAADTCYGFSQEIIKMIHEDPGISVKDMVKRMGISKTTVDHHLSDLRMTKLLHLRSHYTGKKGQPADRYFISNDFQPIVSDMFG
jgi:DNA-binding transcriptional ArsR family regulator